MTNKELKEVINRILPDRYDCCTEYNNKEINGVYCFDKSYKGMDEEQWGYFKLALKQKTQVSEFYHHQCTNHIEFEVRL